MKPFYEQPILNSPYYAPTRHHALGDDGRPLEHDPIKGRRRSRYMVPVPKSRRDAGGTKQAEFGFGDEGEKGRYSENAIVNEIRGYLESWRTLPDPVDWDVTIDDDPAGFGVPLSIGAPRHSRRPPPGAPHRVCRRRPRHRQGPGAGGALVPQPA